MEPPSQRAGQSPASVGRPGIEAPLPDRPAAAVTLVLLNGNEQRGRLARFQPQQPDLALEVQREPGRASRLLVQAEKVAVVVFHREPGDGVQAPLREATRLRVHTAGGRVWRVEAASASHTLGFYGAPVGVGEHREYFFYNHGVNARERDEPLGELLVREGKVSAEALRHGLDSQVSSRSAPLGQILIEQQKLDASALDQALELQRRRRLRLGEVLVEAGLASQASIEAALAEQRLRKGKRLGELLVEMGLASEGDIAATLAKKFQLPLVDLDQLPPPPVIAEVSREQIARFGVLPLAIDAKSLTLAISDPLATDVLDVLRIETKRRINEVMVVPSQLRRHVQQALDRGAAGEGAPALEDILRHLNDDPAVGGVEEEEDDLEVVAGESDRGVIRLVNQIIIDAHRRGASDIHIEPNGRERSVAVRFRVDGDCHRYLELPAAVRGPVVARIKIMARLDISERRKPQDGKIRFRMGEQTLELRVATIPNVTHDEDVVLRLLAASKPAPLARMGMRAPVLASLKELLDKPYGLLLCVGPTGSGKTTTLHSALGHLNTADRKIWTAEDPVEITQPGLRQVQVHGKIGFTFAAAMRAFLRADPDVIMVGEMRDVETASTAIEASLTGHLVLSTLHTNSAPETITRLLDMGLDPFSFSDALLGVLAQRLVRALCERCKSHEPGTREEFDEMAALCGGPEGMERRLGVAFGPSFRVYRARGCAACGDSGYKGRLGLHELLVTSEAIVHAIAHKAPVDAIRTMAVASGMATLAQDGVEKSLAGLTDMRQVLAVCSRLRKICELRSSPPCARRPCRTGRRRGRPEARVRWMCSRGAPLREGPGRLSKRRRGRGLRGRALT